MSTKELAERLRGYSGPWTVPKEAADELDRLSTENQRLREALEKPPRHMFWGAGEKDCPRELKAPNGELHTLRCKICGKDSPESEICLSALEAKP